MPPSVLVLLTVIPLGAPPPLLLEPQAAREEARALGRAPETALGAAEMELMLGDPRAALEALERTEAPEDDPRVLRLALEAHLALGHDALGNTLAARLARSPGWANYTPTQNVRAAPAASSDLGAIMFAAAMAVFLLGGGRALLRVHRPAVMLGLLVALGAALSWPVAPHIGPLITLFGLSLLALAHGALATQARNDPGPRARALLTTLFLLGGVGAALLVLANIPISVVVSDLITG